MFESGTDINDAILQGLEIITSDMLPGNQLGRLPVVIFLTDGKPSAGVRAAVSILENVKQENKINATIFSLVFGNEVDIPFLKRLSLRNNGKTTRIYDGDDIAEQITKFFHQVESPLVTNLKLDYPTDVDMSTLTNVDHTYFNGSDLVIAGKLTQKNVDTLPVRVTGWRHGGFFSKDYTIKRQSDSHFWKVYTFLLIL